MAAKAADLVALLARVTDDNAAQEYYLVDIVNIANGDGRSCAVVVTDPYDVAGINSRGELAAMEGEWQARRRSAAMADGASPDRKSVVSGKRVSVRVDLGVRRIIKKKKQ